MWGGGAGGGGGYNPSQNTLRLKNKFEKCISSFTESLIFLALSPNFYFCKGDWALDYVRTQFRDFSKISSFFKLFDNSWDILYIQFVVIMI